MDLKSSRIISTIKDQVYEVLKENILNGTLQPGERIQEVKIAKNLNVSRSPVRNAINKLVGEGLLESIPNKCVCVRQITDREIIESYEFRLIIEKFAVERLCTIITPEITRKLQEIRKQFIQTAKFKYMNNYLKVDAEFHEYIVSVCGNHVITEALDKVSMMISPFRVLALSKENRFYESVEEHTQIIDALLAHDAAQAVSACAVHLTLAKEEILKHIDSQ